MEKYQIVANGLTFNCDAIKHEYSQLDGEGSGRSEDGTMIRDVIGTVIKIHCGFEQKYGAELRSLLSLVSLTSTDIDYYDFRTGSRMTKAVYVTYDPIEIRLINGEEYADRFDIRFIQMGVG